MNYLCNCLNHNTMIMLGYITTMMTVILQQDILHIFSYKRGESLLLFEIVT